MTQELLIVGGGYAGLWAAIAAARKARDAGRNLSIRLLNKTPRLVHRPRLYERQPENMYSDLKAVLEPIAVELIVADVQSIDPDGKQVRARSGSGQTAAYAYDGLVFAAGSVSAPVPWGGDGGDTWSIDSLEDAVALDRHLAGLADTPGPDTVAIVGAGFTGIELAAEMRGRLAEHIGPQRAEKARILLLDAAATVSEELGVGPRPHILAALDHAGVELRLNTRITRIDGNRIKFDAGQDIMAATIVVTTGMRANPLTAGFGLALDAAGRLPVDRYLAINGLSDVHAAGDVAHAMTDERHLALMSCQHAMPMGRHAGHNAAAALLGLSPHPYRQERYVTCLDLGPWGAVFTNGWDRQVEAIEQEAKSRKRSINGERIYPPRYDRGKILKAGSIT